MHFLYTIFISPFVFLLSYIFNTSYALTNNYGISLVLLSASVSLLMYPLFYLAELWKRQEAIIQNQMKPKIATIKKAFSASKQYYLIKETHRVFDYKSWYAFRTSFGLIIQIPIFFAAYNFLSQYAGFVNVPLFFINDLAKPDSLLLGINILPILMTIINIISSIQYIKISTTKPLNYCAKEILQLSTFALVFLVLLYNSPSALVLYWTLNNLFGFFKNYAFSKSKQLQSLLLIETQTNSESKTFADYAHKVKNTITNSVTISEIIGFFCLALFIFQCYMMTKYPRDNENWLIPSGLFVAFSGIVFFIIWLKKIITTKKGYIDFIKIIPLAGLYIFSATIIIFRDKFDFRSYETSILLIAALTASLLIYNFVKYCFFTNSKFKQDIQNGKQIFFALSIFLISHIFLFSPILIYANSPQDTNTLFTSFVIYCLITAIILVGFVIIFTIKVKKYYILNKFLLTIYLLVILYSLFKGDFGLINNNNLANDALLGRMRQFIYMRDFFIIILLYYLAQYILKKYYKKIIPIAIMVFVLLISYSGYMVFQNRNTIFALKKIQTNTTKSLPENYEIANSYSKTQQNIVYIVADMFAGGFFQSIIEENPEYKEIFSGFTYFPNTLSVAEQTIRSVPAIFAGYEFSPYTNNGNSWMHSEKFKKKIEQLFDTLESNKYSITTYNSQLPITAKTEISYTSKDYVAYWKNQNGINEIQKQKNESALFSMISLFQFSPFFLKPLIYDHSNWLLFSKNGVFAAIREATIENIAYIDLLPKISTTNAQNKTFKYFHFMLPHSPYGITKNGEIILNNYPIPELKSFNDGPLAYYSAQKLVTLLANWILFLKKNNIYDNTVIIVVADHGGVYAHEQNPFIPKNLDETIMAKDFNHANTLFMFKNINENFAFKTDYSFMSNADAAIVLQNFILNQKVTTDMLSEKNRQLIFSDLKNNIPIYYKVTNSMLETKNWEQTQ